MMVTGGSGTVHSTEPLNPTSTPAREAEQAPPPSEAAVEPNVEPNGNGAPELREKGLYLIGRPTLKQFLRHVRRHAVDPPAEADLIDEWNAANRVLHTRERDEAGLADDAPIVRMGPEYTPLLSDLLRDPMIRHGFNSVPTEVALVDLERVVVYQKHIDLGHVARLERELPPELSREQIFRFCLPYDHALPPVRWSRTLRDKFVFVSPSNDLRFLGIMPLEAHDIPHTPHLGVLVGVVGIAVGFGSNFLNAVYAERRLILRNGSHRAYLLRKRGITRVPCIIQHASSREELEVVGSSALQRDPDLYLSSPRPPMLRDYFDPDLHKVMTVQQRLHQVTVSFDAEEGEIPVL